MKLEQANDKLELIACKTFENMELYKVVDFLNKSLKEKKIIFGLSKDTSNGAMTITIYQV